MKNLLINVSGGRSSAMMARHIQTSEKYKDFQKLFVFCNTGLERPETIDFLKDMVLHWGINLCLVQGIYSQEKGVGVRSELVDWDELDMDGRIFKNAIQHLQKNKWTGVPNQATPYCSEYLKKRVSHHFAKQVFGSTDYISAIGFRFEDMPKRITWAEMMAEKRIIYPLLTDFDYAINQFDLNKFFAKEKFRLKIHSKLGNCAYCQKKSDRNLIECIQFDLGRQNFKYIDWYRAQERKYDNTFFRGNLSIDDLVRMAQSGMQMEMFSDEGEACNCGGY